MKDRNEELDELERRIHEAISFHRDQYEKAIKPYIDQLVMIQSLRPKVLFVSRDQIAEWAIVPFSPPSAPSR
jgi:hypothetical protein